MKISLLYNLRSPGLLATLRKTRFSSRTKLFTVPDKCNVCADDDKKGNINQLI